VKGKQPTALALFSVAHSRSRIALTKKWKKMSPAQPSRSSKWQLRTRELTVGRYPLIMGIVNVTPDSFSDGGSFFDKNRAIEHGLQLAAEGADILDVGGESTRPYSEPVTETEERRRVVGVVACLAEAGMIVSIDTSKASVANESIQAGAEIINDVTGLEGDPEMLGVAVETQAGVCAMHMQGSPQTMQDDPHYEDVVAEIYAYLQQRRDRLLAAGISQDRICLDPGIGFGKKQQHNLELLQRCSEFHTLGCPLLVGHSRKGFIMKQLGEKLGNDENEKNVNRLSGGLGVSMALARYGVQVVRVHDVAATRSAFELFEASGGLIP